MIFKLLNYLPYEVYLILIKELCRVFPNKIETKNYYMDYWLVEAEYSIFSLPAGYWAYGYFEPNTPTFLLDREEELDRVGVII